MTNRLWQALFIVSVFAVGSCDQGNNGDDNAPEGTSDGDPLEYHDEPPEEDQQDDFLPSDEELVKVHAFLDTNKDGKVDTTELLKNFVDHELRYGKKYIAELMTWKDRNHDGKLDFDEYIRDDEPESDASGEEGQGQVEDEDEFHKKHREEEATRFKVADVNGDGFLQDNEVTSMFYPITNDAMLVAVGEASLKRKDLNEDGAVDKFEFWEVEGMKELSEDEEAEFAYLDKDSNGKVDLEEMKRWEGGTHHFQRAMHELVAVADKDGDGHLSTDELSFAKKALPTSEGMYQLKRIYTYSDEL